LWRAEIVIGRSYDRVNEIDPSRVVVIDASGFDEYFSVDTRLERSKTDPPIGDDVPASAMVATRPNSLPPAR
jgi:hypothetical protein